MPRALFDHTGDIGVTLTSATLGGLFDEAARAFTATLIGDGPVSDDAAQEVSLTGATLDDLMVEWLGEILYLFEVRNLLVQRAEVDVDRSDGGWQLGGRVHGETAQPDRHIVQVLIKGITYHRLHVREADGGWTTDVVFDI